MTMLKTIVLLTVVTHALLAVDMCVDYSRDNYCSQFKAPCSNDFCRVTCGQCTQPAPVASSLSLKNDCLDIINAKRRLHQNTPDLTWDGVIEAKAQALVNDVTPPNSLKVDASNFYGKALYINVIDGAMSNAKICQDAVSHWNSGGANYDYSVAPSSPSREVNYFTQMIWKSTTKVGFGIAIATHNNWNYIYVMALFHKVGNTDGYTTNVMPLKTTTPSATTPAPPPLVTTQPPTTTTKAATTQVSGSNLHESSCLPIHNILRARHVNTPSLVYDALLETEAQIWAEYLASIYSAKHSDYKGENLSGASTSTPAYDDKADCEDATNSWYNEFSDYDYNNPVYSNKTGHFTQLVWSSSTRLGVGIARSIPRLEVRNNVEHIVTHTYVVARYAPIGNVEGQFVSNVNPVKS